MGSSSLLDNTLEEFKVKLASQLMNGFTIIVCIGLPLSLSRWFEIGFQSIYILHIIITACILACYFRRDKSNYKLDFIVIIAVLSMMIVGGVTSFGLQSGVITFATFTSFLFAILWGVRPAIWFSIAWFCFILLMGHLFVNGYMEYAVAPEIYSATFGSWIVVSLGSCLSITFILIGAHQGLSHLGAQLLKIENQKQEIEYLANHDTLTGYYSPRLAMPILESAVSLAKRNDTKVAVVFIDLNEFKQINDTLGHDIGDAVLIKSATLLKEEIRDMDSAIRIGGDEFLFVLPNIQSAEKAVETVQRLVNRLSMVSSINGHPVRISASAGIALFPDDSESAKQLRIYADKSMYAGKQQKGSHIKLYCDYAMEKAG